MNSTVVNVAMARFAFDVIEFDDSTSVSVLAAASMLLKFRHNFHPFRADRVRMVVAVEHG